VDDSIDINLRAPRDVALRLLIEIGIVNRAGLEAAKTKEQRATANEDRFDLLAWLIDAGADALMTPFEQALFKESVGKIDKCDVRELAFAMESAAILAWSLGQFEVDPGLPSIRDGGALLAALPGPGDDVGTFLSTAHLRELEEIAEAREIAEIWWWRFDSEVDREMLSPAERKELDDTILVTSDEAMTAGYLREEVNGDFAIDGVKVRDLDEESLDDYWWITQRRAKALNWLCGYGATWDDAPVFVE
jgi:hypothetical protein